MKRPILFTIPTITLVLLAGCGPNKRELNHANLTQAMNDYLAKRGDLCLAKNSWPVVVTEAESKAGSRNALQMPVLERLGLVEGVDALVEQAGEDGAPSQAHARRYALTAEGRKYYLARPAHKLPSGDRYADAAHDFCAARLSLDQVVGWEPSRTPGAQNEAVVTYTYKVKPAPWTGDRALRAVFPMVDTVLRGAGTLQLKEVMVLGAGGWEAKDL
ncbi:MAG TPA: hypothetical protein VF793_10940 [Telluria sp.]